MTGNRRGAALPWSLFHLLSLSAKKAVEAIVVAPLANLEAQRKLCLSVPGGLLLPPIRAYGTPGDPKALTVGAFVLNFYVMHLLSAFDRDTNVTITTRRSV